MIGSVVVDIASTVGFLGVCGTLFWLLTRLEPHWSSKDGRRMIARIQALGPQDNPEGTWKEVRILVDGDHLVVSARGPRAWKMRGRYRPIAKSPNPPTKREIYILQGETRVLLRIPSTSRAIDVIDGLL
ncbi:MAG: hypothetical protein ACKOI2_04665 [Actinomycetota bacterium]